MFRPAWALLVATLLLTTNGVPAWPTTLNPVVLAKAVLPVTDPPAALASTPTVFLKNVLLTTDPPAALSRRPTLPELPGLLSWTELPITTNRSLDGSTSIPETLLLKTSQLLTVRSS